MGLANVDPSLDIVAWYLHARGMIHPERFFSEPVIERASLFPARLFGAVSWRLGVPRAEWLCGGFDLMVATNFVAPATSRPAQVIMVVHDLAFERMPETAPHHDARWRRRFASGLQLAAGVIVPSVSARDDLLGAHPIDPSKVHVVHHGVSVVERPSARTIAETRARFGVPERYVLFVGGLEPRKNVERLARAFLQVDSDAALVIAGGAVRWLPDAARRLEETLAKLGDGRRVIRTGGYVSDAQRDALLAGATLLAYPSLYEGFGFPVLEAFAAGVPVLTSNSSSLPEVAGDAALLIEPTDEEQIAAGLARLLDDAELRDRLRQAGRNRVSSFTWEACARSTADVLYTAFQGAHG